MIWRVLAVCLVAGVVAWSLRPRPRLVIRIRGGRAEVIRGSAPRGFVADCERICHDLSVADVTIRGYAGPKLKIGRQVDPRHHQRFRNALHLRA